MVNVFFAAQIALIAVGAVLIVAAPRGWRAIPRNMRFHVVFRRVMAGVIALGAGAGWLLGWPALIAAALIIGFGELFETTLDISALDQGNRGESPLDHTGPRRTH
jgi:hypothetical protein